MHSLAIIPVEPQISVRELLPDSIPGARLS